jgi:hypothetical protein
VVVLAVVGLLAMCVAGWLAWLCVHVQSITPLDRGYRRKINLGRHM